MSIYTKSGDSGLASTLNRRSIAKNSPIFSLLGTLDELNSTLGVARSKFHVGDDTEGIIQALQRDIIAFSGELAGGTRFATAERVAGMEQSIDLMMETSGQFDGFVTPGDSEAGAALDLSRTVARRAERELCAAKQTGGVSREAMMYLNRLSDLLYALARLTDYRGAKPAEEKPAKTMSAAIPAPQARGNYASETAAATGTGGEFMELSLLLCRKVLEAAKLMGINVVTAACDAGGNLVSLLRADGAYIASVDIATNKAYTSVSVQMPTEALEELCRPGGSLYGLQNTNQNRMVIFGGGIPLYDGDRLIGGFGVSGGSAEQDTTLAHIAQEIFAKIKEAI